MLRSMLGVAAVSGALALGVLPGTLAPASARPASDDVQSLPVHPEWGSVTGVDGRLLRSCRAYNYTYSIKPPEGVWAVEFFITGPGGEALWNGGVIEGGDPLTGTLAYTLCRNTTSPGTFTIRAKLSSERGSNDIIEGQLPPDTFTLTRKGKEVWAEQPL